MQGFYLLVILLACAFAIDGELTARILRAASLKAEIYVMNLRTKWAAWRMYRSLVKICKENGFPEPGPFVYVDLWDRES
jgi:hypothetical protein